MLPILGAVPDSAIIVASGLGDDAQEKLSVGMGWVQLTCKITFYSVKLMKKQCTFRNFSGLLLGIVFNFASNIKRTEVN